MTVPRPKQPWGMLTFAALSICAVTGVMLATVYRPAAPLDSLALLQLKNPGGIYIRGLHDWSAQLMLVLGIVHVIDSLWRRSDQQVTTGRWLALSAAVPLIVWAMLSGFLLRGDAAAAAALEVFRSLAGSGLARLLTGRASDLSTVYLHHIGIVTLLIWLITVDHSRRLLPGAKSVWMVLPVAAIMAVVLQPGLEWREESAEAAPWYLAGLQEALRWTPNPAAAIFVIAVFLLLFAMLPQLGSRTRTVLALACVLYGALTIAAFIRHPASRSWISARALLPRDARLLAVGIPLVAGRREGCLACHASMGGFSKEHEPKVAGCAACHLGNPFALDKTLAHRGMTRTPGNLSLASRTCGTANCHAEIVPRVEKSLMNSMSGVVAVDKVVFGESPDLDRRYEVRRLGHSPADTHLRTLCASCHLGLEKLAPEPVAELSRGGGCSACHLQYDAAAEAELRQRKPGAEPLHHPAISIDIQPTACFGCHSRSGRISTSYEGWHETLAPKGNVPLRKLADGRIFEKRPPDVHFEKGMSCIDCHTAGEVMSGAGSHSSSAIKIACSDCHTTAVPPTRTFAQLVPETQAIVALRKLNIPGRRFIGAYSNTSLEVNGSVRVTLKSTGRHLAAKPPNAACERARSYHQRLDCRSCHTAWAPQCVTCHTRYDGTQEAWDHLDARYRKGEWIEEPADYLSDLPALGVEGRKVTTFAPGMILTINGRFERRFAPVSAHTTTTKARDCRSCHSNPAALGYGRGRLAYQAGEWTLASQFPADGHDGLPRDAWIAFQSEPANALATRKDARPFSLAEQRNILLAGACLTCHSEREPRVEAVFRDFAHYQQAVRPACRLPGWAKPMNRDKESHVALN